MTEAPDLPAPMTPGAYRVALVCLGNICRSPMAHVVLEATLAEAGLGDAVEVVSAGTADYHVGRPMDRRAAATLTTAGYDASRHRAQQLPAEWLDDCDLVLAMDHDNLVDILEGTAHPDGIPPGRVRMFRDFDPFANDRDRDVPDPYYGSDTGFERVLAMVTRTARALTEQLGRALSG